MSLYLTYNQLSESKELDKLVYNSPVLAKWSLMILFMMHGPTAFLLCYSLLFARTVIHDTYIRRLLGWGMIIWTFFNGNYAWMYIYLTIEITREFLRFGIPYLLTNCDMNIGSEPISETLIRRLFRTLKVVTQQHPLLTCQQLLIMVTAFHQKDQTEPFSNDEKGKFSKFFKDFNKSSFMYDSETGSLTIFFPSFIIRFSNQGIQITDDEAMKIICGQDIKEDKCPICMDRFGDISIELKCGHPYCYRCISSWMNQQYTCPICRKEI